MKTGQNFQLVRGDNLTVQFTVADAYGAAKNLAGAHLRAQFRDGSDTVRLEKSSDDADEILVTHADLGEFEMYIVPDDTADLSPGAFYYDVELTLNEQVITVASGRMMVLTDQDSIEKERKEMSYCTPEDLAKVKTPDELRQLSDLQGGGAPDPTVLQAACDQASALMDGLISPQYPLPLETVPAMLQSIAVRLALYYLYLGRHSMPEEAKNGYDRDVAFLEKVGKGQASLGEPNAEGRGDRFHGAKAQSDRRRFDRDGMRGF